MRLSSFALTFALVTAACGGGSAAAVDPSRPRPSSGRAQNLVTAEDIQRHGGQDLHEVLRQLRPGWFRQAPTQMTRGGIYADPVAIYIDGRRVGGPSNLSDIPVKAVVHARFYSASEAQGRFGLDNLQGAIEVSLMH